MNFKVELILFLALNIHFNNVKGQGSVDICNDTVPESYRKMVLSQERKEFDSQILYSYLSLDDTLSISDSTYCEYTLKYINCEGLMGDDSKVSMGSSLCEFLEDKSIVLKVRKSSIRAFVRIIQFGDNYIVFQHSLITGPNNDVWYFFERDFNLKEAR